MPKSRLSKGLILPLDRRKITSAKVLEAAASIFKAIYDGVAPNFKGMSEGIRVKAYDLLRFDQMISKTSDGFKVRGGEFKGDVLQRMEDYLERARKLRGAF